MSTNGNKARYETLRSIAFGTIGTGYTQIGTNLSHPVRILVVTNTTNQGLFFSYDGSTDNSWIPAGTVRQINYCANTAGAIGLLEHPMGTGIFTKYVGVAPTSGNVYVEAIYADN